MFITAERLKALRTYEELVQRNPALELSVFSERAAPTWPRPTYQPEGTGLTKNEPARAVPAGGSGEQASRTAFLERSGLRVHQLSDEEQRALGELYARNPMLMAMPAGKWTHE